MEGFKHNYICRECALAKGAVGVEGHACTAHFDLCKYCKENDWLAHLSDWNWPDHPKLEKNREL